LVNRTRAGALVTVGLVWLLVWHGPWAGAAPLDQTPAEGTPTPVAETGCQPQALIDSPTADHPLTGVVPVGGWAIDVSSPAGTGVTDVHVYLDGYGSEPGHTFIGRAEYGNSRVDVAQQFNDVRFARSAFSLSWDASTAGQGPHTLVVLYRTRCGWASITQGVEVDGPTIRLNVDQPAQGSAVEAPVRLQGWAADPAATVGTGVERVDIYLDGQITTRGVPLGEVTYGESRPDVAAALGGQNEDERARFARSGFASFWSPAGIPAGTHSLTFYARGPSGAVARSLTLEVRPGASGTLGLTPQPSPAAARGTDVFGVGVSATTPTSVALTWAAVNGASVYDVYESDGVAAFFPAAAGISDVRTTITGLAPGRTYRFYVRALDGQGNEVGRSNTVNVTTGTATLPPPTAIASPTPLGRTSVP
jgi:hypothetical protein